MNLFVWNWVDHATDRYHSQGGILVIADSLERAREMVTEATAHVDEECEAIRVEPKIVRECAGPECIIIHPDAGCC